MTNGDGVMMGNVFVRGGTTAELAGKVVRLCARSVVPHRQAGGAGGGSQKQLRVLPPCMFVKEAVI
jgi:hypothetical protein